MYHQRQGQNEPDVLRARFTNWIEKLIKKHYTILAKNKLKNPNFKLHGGTVESFDDHRVAMSLACLGLGLPEGQEVIVNDAECCSVSFPKFFEVMNKINANFTEI